ncbi:MAG: hypothetical protein SPL00_03405, partial [Bacilli bacterium]|nr:hypothetical protein [Bacilli bacterium]
RKTDQKGISQLSRLLFTKTCFENELNRVMPNGTLRGVRGRRNYLIFLPTRLFLSIISILGLVNTTLTICNWTYKNP